MNNSFETVITVIGGLITIIDLILGLYYTIRKINKESEKDDRK